MPANSPWPLVERKCETLLAALRASAHLEPQEIPTHNVYVLAMYWRCVRLFDATFHLLKAELPEEAAIVARSLFEESLRLQQLAADEPYRDALVLGWANSSISERLGLLSLAKSIGLDDDTSEAEGKLNGERRSLQAYQQRRGVARLRRFASEREAATRLGRQSDYWAYALGHELVHGSDVAWMFARRRLAPDVVGLYSKTDAPGIRAAFAEFAASSATAAAVAACAMFEWLRVESFEQPLAAIRELLAQGAG